MARSDVSFSKLSIDRRTKTFISFPADAETLSSSPSVRLSKAFTDLLTAEHGEDFCVNYVRDQGGHPWLAVTEAPDAVGEDTAPVGLYDGAGHVNSTHLCRLLATQWANGEDEKTARLYYAHEKEPLGEHWMLYRLEEPSE